MKVLPIFKSNYSIGKSILTLEKKGTSPEGGADSIIDLALAYNIPTVYLAEDNMSSFLEAYKNVKEAGLKLVYGVRLSFTPDIEEKSDETKHKHCKYIVFARNDEGYKRLVKIYSTAAKKGFYYFPRMDFKTLKTFWDEKDLLLVVPFYDSFLYQNSLTTSVCIPDFSFARPIFFIENNQLPFDEILTKRVLEYCREEFDTVNVQSVFYAKKRDFKAFLTFRCLANGSKLDKPELDHFCSNEFSLEGWREKNK
jgi:DNA polymerase III subunit alpha